MILKLKPGKFLAQKLKLTLRISTQELKLPLEVLALVLLLMKNQI